MTALLYLFLLAVLSFLLLAQFRGTLPHVLDALAR